ncbi:nucleoside diphosphate kinase [Plasmodium falciparum IGH-CR14]|uniref:nucleoside-diphosphate kinase n=1 Tax=Plasmodium falciparum IGH-CR14 TaxID=580059 RepID=A0A0L1I624_PLAFA|nr:nucleoside diphosphate kinase [Plasmodium falciparum IGH-CR14]
MKDERCIFIILPDVTNDLKNEIKEIFDFTPEQYNDINEFYDYIESGLSLISLIEHIEGDTISKLNSLTKSTSILIKDEKYFECLEYQCNLKCKNVPFYFSKNEWYFIRDIDFFFPSYDNICLERTFIILKPDVVEMNKMNAIVNDILNFDLLIVAIKRGVLSVERAKKLYSDLVDKPYYNDLIDFMTSSKGIVCLLIEGPNCIRRAHILCGPSFSLVDFEHMPNYCLKKKYGTNQMKNAVHISKDDNVEKEIDLFFGNENFKSENGIIIIKESILGVDGLMRLREYLNDYGFRILEEKLVSMRTDEIKSIYDMNGINYLNDHSRLQQNIGNNNLIEESNFIIILLSRINCQTCLHYLKYLDIINKCENKKWNNVKFSFSINNCDKDKFCIEKKSEDVIYVYDVKKVNELIKKYFIFERYNDKITIDMIKNFLFCKNVTNKIYKDEENIKLSNVLMEGLSKICEKKPMNNSAVFWLCKWIKQREKEIKNDIKIEEELKRKEDILNLEKKKKKGMHRSDTMEVNNFNKSLKLCDDDKLLNVYKNKEIIIIPDIKEDNVDFLDEKDNYVERAKSEIIKYFEKLNYVHLNFDELCTKEEKKNSLLGKKIEYTKRKYKQLTADLIKRILKENLERNKLYYKFVLTGFSNIIDTSYLSKDDIIQCSFCLIIKREEEEKSEGEYRNDGDEKVEEMINEEEVINEEVINKEEVINEEVINEEVINKEAINKEVINKEVINKKVINKKEEEHIINNKEKYLYFLKYFYCIYKDNNYIMPFLNKGKILIYRKSNFQECIRMFENEVFLFYGIKKKSLKNIITYLKEFYNFYVIDHMKWLREKREKKLKNNECIENKDEYFMSISFFSYVIEKWKILINKDCNKKFILCNYPYKVEHIEMLEKMLNVRLFIFYFKNKKDDNISYIKEGDKILEAIGEIKYNNQINDDNNQINYNDIRSKRERNKYIRGEKISYTLINNLIHKVKKKNTTYTKYDEIINKRHVFTFDGPSKGTHEYVDEIENFFSTIMNVAKKKVILICNMTNKDINFIGFYLQYAYANMVFYDLNVDEDVDDNISKFLKKDIKNIIEEDVIYNDSIFYKNKDTKANILINKMTKFISTVNASYYVFSNFPTNLNFEDYEKIHLFFEIKLAILMVEDDSYMNKVDLNKLSEHPFGFFFFYFYNRGSLLVMGGKAVDGMDKEKIKMEEEDTDKEKIKMEDEGVEREKNKFDEVMDKEKINLKMDDLYKQYDNIKLHNEEVTNQNELHPNNIFQKNEYGKEFQMYEYDDDMKKVILSRIDERIGPRLICYYVGDEYDLDVYLKKRLNKMDEDIFHLVSYDDVIKGFMSMIINQDKESKKEKKKKENLKKLVEDIRIRIRRKQKNNKEYIKTMIYKYYLKYILKNKSRYLFSNIIVYNIPPKEIIEEDILKDYSYIIDIKKVIHFVYFIEDDNYNALNDERICSDVMNEHVFSFMLEEVGLEKVGRMVSEENILDVENASDDQNVITIEGVLNERNTTNGNVDSAKIYEENEKGRDNEMKKEEENKKNKKNKNKKMKKKMKKKKETTKKTRIKNNRKEKKMDKYNKELKKNEKIFLSKYKDIEFTRIYIDKELPCNMLNIYCPKIIILFIPQNIYLQLYISSLICLHLKNYKSINTASLIYEIRILERMKKKMVYIEKCKKGGEGEKDTYISDIMDEKRMIRKIYNYIMSRIKRVDSNILLCGFPIFLRKSYYNNKSDYFYQFDFLKKFKIDGIISFLFDDTYLEQICNGKNNVCAEKYKEILNFMYKEYRYKCKIYYETIRNNDDLQNVLAKMKNNL